MEVEYNPIPEEVPDVEISAERFFAANIAFGMLAAKYLSEQGYKVRVLNPDRFELGNCNESASYTIEQCEGKVTVGHSREHQPGPLQSLSNLFASNVAPQALPDGAEDADVYIAINHQSGDFKVLQTYAERVIGDKPLVLWNPELAEARGKFGVPGFPPRSLHWEFLSFFKPIYFIQKRDFTVFRLSNNQPPIDVSGCLFREFPGPYRCMVRPGMGEPYRTYSSHEEKPTIQEVLQQLRRANGIPRERQKGLIAWWEKDQEREKSSNWRK